MCRFAFARTNPSVDDSQDIEMTSAGESDGTTVISFSRLFHTSDSDDLPLNSAYVLWAFGGVEANFDPDSSSSISQHAFSNRGALMNLLPSSPSLCVGKHLSNPGNLTALVIPGPW